MAYRQLTESEWEDLASKMHTAEIQLTDRDEAIVSA